MTRRHRINKGAEYEIPFEYAVSRGNIEGIDRFIKFAREDGVGTAQVDVSDFGDLVYLTAAQKLDISSTSGEDAAGGTGATLIRIAGLDADYNEIEEDIIPTGATPKETQNSYLRVYRMQVLTAGTAEGAVGNILLKDSLANVQAQIVNGNNGTLMSHYTIPAGKTGHLLYGDASCSSGKSVTIKYKIRGLGGVFIIGQTVDLFESNYLREFRVPAPIPEKSDIKVTAQSSASGTSVSINYDLLLIENDL